MTALSALLLILLNPLEQLQIGYSEKSSAN